MRFLLVCAALAAGVVASADPVQYPGNNHWYDTRVLGFCTWSEANAYATNVGAHLASITSAGENAFIAGIANNAALYSDYSVNGDRMGPWIGGVYVSGTWQWTDGSPMNVYSNWYPGQPDYYGGFEQKMIFYAGAGIGSQWADHPGTPIPGYSLPRGCVIEWDGANIDLSVRILGFPFSNNYAGHTANIQIIQNGLVVQQANRVLGASGECFVVPQVTGEVQIRVDCFSGLSTTVSRTIVPNQPLSVGVFLNNGDCDESGEVDAVDIDAVIAAFGTNPLPSAPAPFVDVDGSGEVDAADIDVVISFFGATDQ